MHSPKLRKNTFELRGNILKKTELQQMGTTYVQ